jgi:hypothetical protein
MMRLSGPGPGVVWKKYTHGESGHWGWNARFSRPFSPPGPQAGIVAHVLGTLEAAESGHTRTRAPAEV